MTQEQLNREVARATGETIQLIREMGFGLLIMPDVVELTPQGGEQANQIPGQKKDLSADTGVRRSA